MRPRRAISPLRWRASVGRCLARAEEDTQPRGGGEATHERYAAQGLGKRGGVCLWRGKRTRRGVARHTRKSDRAQGSRHGTRSRQPESHQRRPIYPTRSLQTQRRSIIMSRIRILYSTEQRTCGSVAERAIPAIGAFPPPPHAFPPSTPARGIFTPAVEVLRHRRLPLSPVKSASGGVPASARPRASVRRGGYAGQAPPAQEGTRPPRRLRLR